MFNEEEVFFHCPYCFQRISMLIEEIYGNQQYIEDCEVCCQPIAISITISEGEIQDLQAERAD